MKVGATKLAPPEMTTKATMRVICFDEFGGPDVLKLEEIPLAEPGADEVRIRVMD